MKKTLTRIMCVLIVLMMIVPTVVSCVKTPSGPTDKESATDNDQASVNDTDGETEPETERTALNLLGEKDFKNETVTFYVRDYGGVWDSDIVSHEILGEVINDAVYRRTMIIEETFKVKLATVSVGNTGNAVVTKIKNEIQGEDVLSFDAVHIGLRDTASLLTEGMFQNLKGMPNLSLDADYWSPFLTEQLSIAGKIYGITGEISAEDNMSVRCYFFNKDIARDRLGLSDDYFYNLVDNYEWTFEEVFKCSKEVFSDGGDGVAELTGDGDMFGVTAQPQFGFVMLMGTGTKVIGKDKNDIPYIALDGNQVATDIVDGLTRNINGNEAIRLDGNNDNVINCFTNGKALFMPEVLQHAGTMRTSNSYNINFGILPMPLCDKTQTEYVQYSDAYCPDFFSIPVKIKDAKLDRITFILEAIAIESRKTLTPAYYEVCLKGRYSTDESSAKMIDIILSNYNIDLCDVYLSAWSDFRTTIQNAISDGKSITTTVSQYKRAINAKIGVTVKSIQALP